MESNCPVRRPWPAIRAISVGLGYAAATPAAHAAIVRLAQRTMRVDGAKLVAGAIRTA